MKSIKPEFVTKLPVHAASGLIIARGKFFVVADDEVHILAGTPDKGFSPYALWKEKLPANEKERKKVKPDFESVFLDGDELVVIPSLSRKNRIEGARIRLSDSGKIFSHGTFSLKGLRKNLDEVIPDLNIEGALRHDGKIHLFQRGNGEKGMNAVIALDTLESKSFTITPVQLPSIRDVKYTITDAAVKDDEIWFLAVAERSDSTYLDGEVLGSALGKFDETFKVKEFFPIDLRHKTEGLAFDAEGTAWLVTDDDSREKPSRLFRYGS